MQEGSPRPPWDAARWPAPSGAEAALPGTQYMMGFDQQRAVLVSSSARPPRAPLLPPFLQPCPGRGLPRGGSQQANLVTDQLGTRKVSNMSCASASSFPSFLFCITEFSISSCQSQVCTRFFLSTERKNSQTVLRVREQFLELLFLQKGFGQLFLPTKTLRKGSSSLPEY